ncbi:MAG TPA: GNAT family N-acetyltransferase [Rubrobacter sp.]|nr:GNAT family N-acetyltransferase [Rubrobacter sp.]
MLDFLSSATPAAPPGAYWHSGDAIWGMYQNTVFDPRREVRLWEVGDELLGFAWLEEPDGVVTQVHPALRGSGILEREMLDWAAHQTHAVYGERAGDELWTRVPEDDPRLAAFLTALGFSRDPDHALKMFRELDGPLPRTAPPEGWTVREVGGEEEWAERVETHREVWHPSRVTIEAYRRLRGAAGFDPWLDLVAVAPDGTFGSYCLCWFDPESRTGLFEPVGTRPAFRGMGLGKSVMLEGLHRLREQGARSAFVTAIHDNDAASGLYESVGFRTVNRERLYRKKL